MKEAYHIVVKSLPRNALLTIYKSFVRTHLDYGDTVMIDLIINHLLVNLSKFNIMLH